METLSTDTPVLPVMNYTGERMVPEKADAATFWEHIYRYRFARNFIRGKDVLDIACGEGYGTAAMMKAGAKSVIGIDISEETCAHARQKYAVDVRCGSALEIPLPDKSVDTVVSFETVEHLPEPSKFIGECRRVLRDEGLLVISTPNKEVYRVLESPNPFHCKEMTEEDFLDIMNEHFGNVRLYTQQLKYASWWSLRSLSTPAPGLRHMRGYYRLRNLLPKQDWNYASDCQRGDPIGQILADDNLWLALTNPYRVHKRSKVSGERAAYFIAVASGFGVG